MKRKAIVCTVTLLLLAAPLLTWAQYPPLPNGGNDPGGSNSPIGGGASLGGGMITLLALAAGYGSRKIYQHRRRIME